MPNLTSRLHKLELKHCSDLADEARFRDDADQVERQIHGLIDRLSDDHRHPDEARWQGLSPAQRVAWAMRFAGWPIDLAIQKLFLEPADARVT